MAEGGEGSGKRHIPESSLVAWWLGFQTFTAVAQVQSLVQELRSIKPQSINEKEVRQSKKPDCLSGKHRKSRQVLLSPSNETGTP